jgi:hypothetical protein
MSFKILVTLAALFNLAASQAPATAPAAAGDGPPLTVNTPTSVQACLPVAISWTGGTPPVYVSLINGGDPTSPILKDFGSQSDSSLTWQVDQPAGSSLTVQIRDSKGKLNYSDKFTVQPSTTTCKPGESAAGAGSAGKTGSTPAPSGNSTGAKPASGATTPAPSTGSSTPPASGSSTSSGSPNNAATNTSTPAGKAPSADASRATPGFFVLAAVGVLAVFA